jgi:hypothetical protein
VHSIKSDSPAHVNVSRHVRYDCHDGGVDIYGRRRINCAIDIVAWSAPSTSGNATHGARATFFSAVATFGAFLFALHCSALEFK